MKFDLICVSTSSNGMHQNLTEARKAAPAFILDLFPFLVRQEHLSLKVPNIDFNYHVCVDSMQFRTHASKT